MGFYYDRGVDRVGSARGPFVNGWAVYSGAEGEDSEFRGFFLQESDAIAFKDAKEGPDDLVFDGCVVTAVLTSRGIYTANDMALEDHDKLRAFVEGAEFRNGEDVEGLDP